MVNSTLSGKRWRSIPEDLRLNIDDLIIIKRQEKIREYHFNIEEKPNDEHSALIKYFHLVNYNHSIKIEIG